MPTDIPLMSLYEYAGYLAGDARPERPICLLAAKPRGAAGITLIELMVVVAILSILVLIALPAYQSYTIRAKVSEGLVMIDQVKTAVTDAYMSNNHWPADNSSAGVSPADSGWTKYIAELRVVDGSVEVEFAIGGIVGETIIFEPTFGGGIVDWDCSLGTLPSYYRPVNCRIPLP